MATVHILYNPKSNNNTAGTAAEKLCSTYPDGDAEMTDVTAVRDLAAYFARYPADDTFILCGGDGTLNRFINDTVGSALPEKLLFCGVGTGNDFLRDIGAEPGKPTPIREYLDHLPTVTVNGKDSLFINGVGYGIDGYCCEVGDAQRVKSDKPINYAAIAVKGLLFHFKPRNASIVVDGVRSEYKKVWLAPTMNGRYYGGGMMAAPGQNRKKNDTVSLLIMFGAGKLKALSVFPSIFKGEHVAHSEMVHILKGHDITVAFDRPTALQIDGETVLGVTEYHVRTATR